MQAENDARISSETFGASGLSGKYAKMLRPYISLRDAPAKNENSSVTATTVNEGESGSTSALDPGMCSNTEKSAEWKSANS